MKVNKAVPELMKAECEQRGIKSKYVDTQQSILEYLKCKYLGTKLANRNKI
jgi:hypothetical protein